MNTAQATIIFSHGKESGPWGSKIMAMAQVAGELGAAVESIDYQGIEDPRLRVEKLITAGRLLPATLILAGSSMGGHVSAAAVPALQPLGVFLLAPAFYMPGYEQYTPQEVFCPSAIVHGWKDDIVPVDNSIRWAREHGAALHLLDSDHRLQDQIPVIVGIFRNFLRSLLGPCGCDHG